MADALFSSGALILSDAIFPSGAPLLSVLPSFVRCPPRFFLSNLFSMCQFFVRRGRKADERYEYRTALECYSNGLKAMQAIINRGILTPRYIPTYEINTHFSYLCSGSGSTVPTGSGYRTYLFEGSMKNRLACLDKRQLRGPSVCCTTTEPRQYALL